METLIFLTEEKTDESSAKILVFHDRFFDTSFMQIRKNKGPKRGPCGKPASTGFHGDVCSFNPNLSGLLGAHLGESSRSNYCPI